MTGQADKKNKRSFKQAFDIRRYEDRHPEVAYPDR